MNAMKSRQNGMTLFSFLVIFIVAGFFILMMLQIVPVYLDHFKILSSLEGLKSEPGIAQKSPQDIKLLLDKRWDMNSITGVSTEENVIIDKKKGSTSIQVAYEVEKHFLANISLLVKFDNTITVGDTN